MKKESKAEKVEQTPPKTWKVTATNGQETRIEAETESVLMGKVLEFLQGQGLAFPIGLKPGGIVEVKS